MADLDVIRRRHASSRNAPTVAILPFALHTPSLEQHVIDGVTCDAAAALATLPDVQVVGPSTLFRMRDARFSRRRVMRDLQIDYTLSADVWHSGDRCRFRVRLADKSDSLIGEEEFEAPLADLHQAKLSIVGKIVNSVTPFLLSSELELAMTKQAPNRTAYDRTLLAWQRILRLNRGEFDLARGELLEAIIDDDNYAMPRALMARWHSLMIGQSWSDNRDEEAAAALRLANDAIQLDPRNSLALATAGHINSFIKGDLAKGKVLLERATTACYSDALAWSLRSGTECYLGDYASARTMAERAVLLSPFDRLSFSFYFFAGLACYLQEDYGAAERWLRRSVAENSQYTSTHKVLCATLVAHGRLLEARAVAKKLLRLEPAFFVSGGRRSPLSDKAKADLYRKHLRAAGAIETIGG